jgi:arylsulfatase A-like enzyme
MSVYPTLCDLASLQKPAWLEGDNIKSILANPAASWAGVGVTTFGQNNHAVRTDRWRYIRYADGAEELYDHDNDEYEWTNLASHSELSAIKSELSKHLPKTNLPASSSGKMKDTDAEASQPSRGRPKGKKAAGNS